MATAEEELTLLKELIFPERKLTRKTTRAENSQEKQKSSNLPFAKRMFTAEQTLSIIPELEFLMVIFLSSLNVESAVDTLFELLFRALDRYGGDVCR